MTEQPEALRLADVLENKLGGAADEDIEQAAAELRRLHTEREAWKRWCQDAEERGAALEKALGQAVEALDDCPPGGRDLCQLALAVMQVSASLKQTLGGKHD